MSTSVESRRGRHAKGSEQPAPAPSRGQGRSRDSRLADWKASWRIALKMARRDLRRTKGRSTVVALMIGIPMLILSLVASLGWASATSGSPKPERFMGTAVAKVSGPIPHQVAQTGADENSGPVFEEGAADAASEFVAAVPIPGFDPEKSAGENAAAIAGVTGGTATPITETSIRVRIGNRRVLMYNLALDGRVADFGDKIELLSGRWPNGPTEALVTEPGIRNGLPRSGTFAVVTEDGTTDVTVVGTGTGVMAWRMVPHLITAEPLTLESGAGVESQQWLISGTEMPFTKLHDLGKYGLPILSAEVMRNPVPHNQLPPEVQNVTFHDSSPGATAFLIAAAIILALVIGLMVAPAFAVSASRQRHTLALAASNGATTRQLRRTVLAQALLLGVLAAIVGALIGVALATGWAWWQARTATDVFVPLIEIPWLVIACFVLIAVIASFTAALLPARRLGRLDIMGVIKGQSVSPPPSKILPLIGLVLMVAGGFAVVYGAQQWSGGETFVAFGAIPLVVGALFLVPMALHFIGRVSFTLPVSLRLAARDAARQRTRSVPTVAAVMGGVAALTISLIAGASDDKERYETYLGETVLGQGMLNVYDPLDVDAAVAVVQEILPEAEIVPRSTIGQFTFMGPVGGAQPFTVLTNTGCSAQKALHDKEFIEAQRAASQADPNHTWPTPPCPAIGGPSGLAGDVIGLPAAEIISRLDLPSDQAARVREGAVVVPIGSALSGDSVTAWSGTFEFNDTTSEPENIVVAGERELALITVPDSARKAGQVPRHTAALMPLELVESEGWPTYTENGTALYVNPAPGDDITPADEKLVRERLDEGTHFSVERGFKNEMTLFFTILVSGAAFILLVIILTSTALSMAEQRRDDSTMAAVGATRGTRRAMAAAQGFTAAAIGAVLGLVVGVLPGIAFTYPLTRTAGDGTWINGIPQDPSGPFIDIPYGFLAFLVIGVPVLAGLISALAVRRAPVVTRRVD